MIGAGQHGFTAGAANRGHDLRLSCGDDDTANLSFDSTPPNMLDHWRTMNIGKRLVGQPLRRHSRRNQGHGVFGGGAGKTHLPQVLLNLPYDTRAI
jgi:hypothetical protein